VLGVLPYLQGFHLESEDAVAHSPVKEGSKTKLNVVIPILPRTSNHTDWDALKLHPEVQVTLIRENQTIPSADLVILPGSKSVQNDLAFLREQGWESYLQKHLRYGGKVMGICGGFQMLGERIHDPYGIESDQKDTESAGLGYIPMTTVLEKEKQLKQRTGTITAFEQEAHLIGYEIHSGVSTFKSEYQPLAQLENKQTEGFISQDKSIIGTYLHGIFDHPDTLGTLLSWSGLHQANTFNYDHYRNAEIDRIADSTESQLNLNALIETCKHFGQ